VKADGGGKAHPTQKPECLLYRVLLACTKKGDVVLDPFFGTGTTGAVARRLGRQWIGIEREKRYVKVARQRIDSTLELDESAMRTMASKRTAPKVPFGSLVETGWIAPGHALTDAKRRWQARVCADGSIEMAGEQGSIHKIGAAAQGRAVVQRLDLLAHGVGRRPSAARCPASALSAYPRLGTK
jgi:modification methylase